MSEQQRDRFFVTVSARKPAEVRKLQAFGMDLFAPTARKQAATTTAARGKTAAAARPFAIEGLLDQAEIDRLRAAGYDVSVDAPMSDRAVKPGDTLDFDAWLAQMGKHTAKDGQVR